MSFAPTMMDTPLTLDWIADRAERWNADGEVISRRPDRSITRTTYGALIPRARRLAGALVHTLNLRLHPDEIAFIANDAGDRMLIVDDCLLPLYDKVVASGAKFE